MIRKGGDNEGGDVGKEFGNAVKEPEMQRKTLWMMWQTAWVCHSDNLGGGSFDRYEDARKYLLEKLSKDNKGAHYEVRRRNKGFDIVIIVI